MWQVNSISTQLKTNRKTVHNILQALEHTNVCHKAKGQIEKSQDNTGSNLKLQMQIKREVLPGELALKKLLLMNIQRIEATTKAKSFMELQSLQEHVTKLTSKLGLEENKNALALKQEPKNTLYTDL